MVCGRFVCVVLELCILKADYGGEVPDFNIEPNHNDETAAKFRVSKMRRR